MSDWKLQLMFFSGGLWFPRTIVAFFILFKFFILWINSRWSSFRDLIFPSRESSLGFCCGNVPFSSKLSSTSFPFDAPVWIYPKQSYILCVVFKYLMFGSNRLNERTVYQHILFASSADLKSTSNTILMFSQGNDFNSSLIENNSASNISIWIQCKVMAKFFVENTCSYFILESRAICIHSYQLF